AFGPAPPRKPGERGGAAPARVSLESLVRRDGPEGEPYLRLPLPEPETVGRFFDALARWFSV
ncbi:MAG: hypothetical protein ACUVYA_04150, partial [Planctomycetota bacterium]